MATRDVALDGYVHPPQQARSRAALQRVVEAAEQVLASEGLDGFTIAGVAELASTSVGGIYRRFPGKEQLLAAIKARVLKDLERQLENGLDGTTDLESSLRAFSNILVEAFGPGRGRVLGELLRDRTPELDELGRMHIDRLTAIFDDSVGRHRDQITTSDGDDALAMVRSTIISAAIHRGVTPTMQYDNLDSSSYAERLADMALVYLTVATSTH